MTIQRLQITARAQEVDVKALYVAKAEARNKLRKGVKSMIHLPELKEIRKERGVTLQMIAEQTSISYAELWNAEYRHAALHTETANAIADVLGVGVRHLTGQLPAPPAPVAYPPWLIPHHEMSTTEGVGM